MTDSHHLGHRERLRERLLSTDAKGIPDYEILELLLFAAKPRGDVKPLAKDLIKTFGSLAGVLHAPLEKLQQVSGMGQASMAALKVVLEASCRLLQVELKEFEILNSYQKVVDYCHARMAHLEREQFRLLFLDRKNQLIIDEIQQEGTISQTAIYPREVVKRALDVGASSIIMVHNHPSGDPTPSESDIDITRRVKQAAHPFDIRLHDHLIIGKFGHASLKDLGLV